MDHVLLAVIFAIVFAIVAAPLGHWTFFNWKNLMLAARCLLFLRGQRVRVSCAALLRVSDSGGKYLLAQTRLRQDIFGPFGGAYKYSAGAIKEFDKLGFEPQVIHRGSDAGIERDLRGFMKGGSVPAFLRWFHYGIDRENDSECLLRELREEFSEIGAANWIPLAQNLEFTLVREVIEPPAPVAHHDYLQMRILRVFDLDTNNPAGKALRDLLLGEAGTHARLALASADEIRAGRCQVRGERGSLGHHAGYLFTGERVRPDEVAF